MHQTESLLSGPPHDDRRSWGSALFPNETLEIDSSAFDLHSAQFPMIDFAAHLETSRKPADRPLKVKFTPLSDGGAFI